MLIRLLPALVIVLCSGHLQRAHAQAGASPGAQAARQRDAPALHSPSTTATTDNHGPDAADTAVQAAREITARPGATGAVRVRLLSAQKDLTVYATRDRKYGVKLCSPDCEREIQPGTFAFGAGVGTRKPKWEEQTRHVDRDQTFLVSYESRRASRILGGLLLPASSVPMLAAAFLHDISRWADEWAGRQSSGVDPAVIAYACLGAVMAVSSIWLLTRRDKAKLETPDERARRIPPIERTDTTLRIPGNSRLSQRVLACAPPEDVRVEFYAEIDAAHRIASHLSPGAFGHGARRCLREAVRGQTLPDAPAGRWRLVFSR